MDYVPVQLGYWNCQDSAPSAVIARSGEGADVNFTAVTETTKETSLYGGQSHCPTCRCFKSSLMDLSKFAVDPTFPRFGLCYRANCYKSDYLQVCEQGYLRSAVCCKANSHLLCVCVSTRVGVCLSV